MFLIIWNKEPIEIIIHLFRITRSWRSRLMSKTKTGYFIDLIKSERERDSWKSLFLNWPSGVSPWSMWTFLLMIFFGFAISIFRVPKGRWTNAQRRQTMHKERIFVGCYEKNRMRCALQIETSMNERCYLERRRRLSCDGYVPSSSSSGSLSTEEGIEFAEKQCWRLPMWRGEIIGKNGTLFPHGFSRRLCGWRRLILLLK